MTADRCRACDDTRYVCENHPDRPWAEMSSHERACGCGAGMPCPECCDPVTPDPSHSIMEAFTPRKRRGRS